MKENEDYELVPSEVGEHWDIRILTGEFIETVFNFGAIKVSDDGESLNYSLRSRHISLVKIGTLMRI